MYSKEELRIKKAGAPDLPELEADDLRSDLVRGVRKASWTQKEAAYYLNMLSPDQQLTSAQKDKVAQTLFWLGKSEMKSKHGAEATPGDYCRFLWAGQYPFSLKMWLMYEMSRRDDLEKAIEPYKVKSRYKKAMDIVQNELEAVTVDDMAYFLHKVSDEIVSDLGFKLLPKRALPTVIDYVRDHKPSISVGRPNSGETKNPMDQKGYLVDLIKKELGYLFG